MLRNSPAYKTLEFGKFLGRICVIGDGAHAISPFLGQGANQAIQDSYLLGKLLTEMNHEAAFRSFYAIRHPTMQNLISVSKGLEYARMGESYLSNIMRQCMRGGVRLGCPNISGICFHQNFNFLSKIFLFFNIRIFPFLHQFFTSKCFLFIPIFIFFIPTFFFFIPFFSIFLLKFFFTPIVIELYYFFYTNFFSFFFTELSFRAIVFVSFFYTNFSYLTAKMFTPFLSIFTSNFSYAIFLYFYTKFCTPFCNTENKKMV